MFKLLAYSTILFFNGVQEQDTTPDMICNKIKNNLETIKSARSYSGYQSAESDEAIKLLTRKSEILHCDEISKSSDKCSPFRKSSDKCSHFQQLYCPSINTFLSESKKSETKECSNVEQRLVSDMHKMAYVLGGCDETPGRCNIYSENRYQKHTSKTTENKSVNFTKNS